ncbi:MAG: L,D-transpeptidase family protein [Sulfurovum sp.]|nr:L,D-transpeptidase family protein [Sulfurovum sp.]MCB4753004.1 L,D-transpeptidase family protein [Sulfurovum sp.]MCB4754234.1 L,D-transpeptidase family protein [Sulfurovum sp.]MCB4761142.1 L,D-transpeptidase family protein [Sulfurovum sp.]MCB4772212.1 L,D-transpeptidase family protein [Sulfurovum sp.]
MKFNTVLVIVVIEIIFFISGCSYKYKINKIQHDTNVSKIQHDTNVSKIQHDTNVSKIQHGIKVSKKRHSIKVNKIPYNIKVCRKELSYGLEIRKDQIIDRLIAYKSKRKIEGYRDGKKVFESRISLGKNADKGDKIQEGDYRTPEGNYTIIRKKCHPRLYRSLLISYPDAQDIVEAKSKGVKPGGYITIHGQPRWNADDKYDFYTLSHDWTQGCIAIPNKKIVQLWVGIRNGVPITIYP